MKRGQRGTRIMRGRGWRQSSDDEEVQQKGSAPAVTKCSWYASSVHSSKKKKLLLCSVILTALQVCVSACRGTSSLNCGDENPKSSMECAVGIPGAKQKDCPEGLRCILTTAGNLEDDQPHKGICQKDLQPNSFCEKHDYCWAIGAKDIPAGDNCNSCSCVQGGSLLCSTKQCVDSSSDGGSDSDSDNDGPTGGASTDTAGCSDQATKCNHNPCANKSCIRMPSAVCKPNYCNGCGCDFYVEGKKVSCDSDKSDKSSSREKNVGYVFWTAGAVGRLHALGSWLENLSLRVIFIMLSLFGASLASTQM
ncbi:hypothetical protein CBR_g29349 [Chara braunii]|uniref:Uncharacterized protein n=1 Tax=Chara braunii TaxID=69332 RepID=A0A388JWJ1_CHABU|nr:hypothetical protein CBR_g29349 [Chara braunii]|eukprot:GBG62150.1 hypothetical protein CBR_g29349 [Chara braunii]